eukprot:3731736-Lingulodinium_polyedra.AAC.1
MHPWQIQKRRVGAPEIQPCDRGTGAGRESLDRGRATGSQRAHPRDGERHVAQLTQIARELERVPKRGDHLDI